MGLKVLAAVALCALVGAGPLDPPAAYLESRQSADGAFAEQGGRPDAALTAWAVLGLRAAGRDRESLARAAAYLRDNTPSDAGPLALSLLALRATGERGDALAERLASLRRPDGRIGPLVNSTIWGVLALRAAGRPVAPSVRYLLRRQASGGGWSWAPGGAPDSNDTAAAVEALRAADVGGKPVARALTYLRRSQNRDGGFALVRGRASDSQSTAWAAQAFLAARARVPDRTFAYLARMRRPDGSYRYSARYVTTPVWVTAQVLPALARKPFPLR